MKRQYLLTVKYIAESDGKEHELVFLCDKYPDLPDNAANDLLAAHLDEEFLFTDYEVKELERPLINKTI